LRKWTLPTQQSDKHLEGKQTYGGYSTSVVVDEKIVRIPENLDEAATAPYMRRSYYMVTTTSLERKKEIK
jgi:D-arabinose 1-dehydrogenase-like Zn-dependent alcohol dehydrogenase